MFKITCPDDLEVFADRYDEYMDALQECNEWAEEDEWPTEYEMDMMARYFGEY